MQNSVGHIKNVTAAALTSYSSTSIDRIAIIGNELSGDLFVPYNLATHKAESDFSLNGPAIKNLTIGNNIYFTDAGGTLYKVDLGAKTYVVMPPQAFAGTLGLALSGSNIYAMDVANNQVILTPADKNNVSKISLNLSGALEFDVDRTNIFVLTKTGVQHFVSGQSKAFNNIITNYSSGAKIYVRNNIYVLDPADKKLIVSDRNGNNISQFTSPQFGNIKDAIIDEAHKIAYVLSDNTVYTISLK